VNLGKLFFPKFPPNRQRKEMRNLILALAVSLVLCAILGAAFYLINQQGHH
jgi:flagellar basal body-associated protein FliL